MTNEVRKPSDNGNGAAFSSQNGLPHEPEDLGETVQRVLEVRELAGNFFKVPVEDLLVLPPSRHVVIMSPDGTIMKSYNGIESLRAEQHNLNNLHGINDFRRDMYRNVTGVQDAEYLGLPFFDDSVQIRVPQETSLERPISVFVKEHGELLYNKMLEGKAKFEDFVSAAIQIARIQQEGWFRRRALGLENVVKDGNPAYFNERFSTAFLGQLTYHGQVGIPDSVQQEMMDHWGSLVASALVDTKSPGYRSGFYFDGAPRHHIFKNGRDVSIDYEYKLAVPAFLGLASLVSFGVTKNKKPYLAEEDILRILDRFVLEMEFTRALKEEKEDLAREIFKYMQKRYQAGNYDLLGERADAFYKFLGEGDLGTGKSRREGYVATFELCQLERQAMWIGHKARQRELARLLSKEKINFEMDDPVNQLRAEQAQHLYLALSIFDRIQDRSSTNGHRAAARSLYNRFNEIAKEPYFSPK